MVGGLEVAKLVKKVMTELVNVSVLLLFRLNRCKSTDALTFLPSQRFSHCVQIIESDEIKNSGIITVDGCERGAVGAEISPSLAALKMVATYPNCGRV